MERNADNRISVSIIIPIYNSMPYLRECLDSIRTQTFADFEVICVDDGSTDESPAVLAEFAEADPRFRVVRQANAGAAEARNRGIREAEGKYLFFADADDRLMPELLEKAVNRGEETQAQVILFGHYELNSDTGLMKPARSRIHAYLKPDTVVFNREDVPDSLFLLDSLVPWNRLVLRSFVLKENLRYQNLENANDYFFSLMCLAVAESITWVDELLYCYRRFHGSATDRTRGRSYLCRLEACQAVRQSLMERDLFDLLGKCWRIKTVGLIGAKLRKEPLSLTARKGLLEKFREETESDPELLGMDREEYEPYQDYYDLLCGGIHYGLPRLNSDEGGNFGEIYRDFLEYRSLMRNAGEGEVPGDGLQQRIARAEAALRKAREGMKALSVWERYTCWTLPDETFLPFVHLVEEPVALKEDAENKKQKNAEYRERITEYRERIEDLKQKNDERSAVYKERIEDLKNKNEEKKKTIERLKAELDKNKPWRR